MSNSTERTIKLAVLTAGVIALLGMAWASKADKSAFDLHVQEAEGRAARLDSMVTDIWCRDPQNAGARRCR